MSNEIVAANNDMNSKLAYAKQLAASNLLPPNYKNNPGNILWAIEYGAAHGLAPVVAIGMIHVIEGKPAMSAQGLAGMVRRAGHRLRVESDDTRAVATIIRADDPDFKFEATFSMIDAKKAKVDGKDTWTKWPRNMMEARAIAAVARKACSEILLGGGYIAEELGGAAFAEDLPAGASIAEPQRWPDAERKAFCAELTANSMDYEDVAEWCQSRGHDRPSGMSVKLRGKVLEALRSPARGGFDAWLASKNATAIDADGVVTDTEEFFDTPPQTDGAL